MPVLSCNFLETSLVIGAMAWGLFMRTVLVVRDVFVQTLPPPPAHNWEFRMTQESCEQGCLVKQGSCLFASLVIQDGYGYFWRGWKESSSGGGEEEEVEAGGIKANLWNGCREKTVESRSDPIASGSNSFTLQPDRPSFTWIIYWDSL